MKIRTCAVAALLLLVAGCASPARAATAAYPAAAPPPAPIVGTLRVLVVGDSISCGGFYPNPGWCPELSRLFTNAGAAHTLIPAAVSGTRCDYWATNISPLLIQHHPDLVVLGCGTNDGARTDVTGQARTDAVKTAVVSVANQVSAAGARLLTGIPSYSGGTLQPGLPAGEQEAYAGIAAAFAVFGGGAFAPVMFDDSAMPPTVGVFVTNDEVHPTPHGYVVLAHDRYRALGSFYQLPAICPAA